MILGAYNLGSTNNTANVGSFKTSDLGNKDPYILVDVLPAGYDDVTSVINLYQFGYNTEYDYKKIRDEIKAYIISLGNATVVGTETDPSTLTPNAGDAYIIGAGAVGEWSGLDNQVAIWDGSVWSYYSGDGISTSLEEYGFDLISPEEQKIAAGYLIGSIAQQITAFGGNATDKEKAQGEYNLEVTDCRNTRYLWAQTHFMNHIPANAAEVLSVIEANKLDKRYVYQGIFGEEEFDDISPGVADYIDGVGQWAGAGIKQKAWTTLYGANMDTFCAELKDVLFYTGVKP